MASDSSADQGKKTPSAPLVLVSVKNGVCTIKFNRPERFNAWSVEMIIAWQEALLTAAKDDSVKAAILTGAGKYYCSGVDFGGALKPMLPRKLIEFARTENQKLFEIYLEFPKPLFAAVNGPAIGAAVTSASLCDLILASDKATFHTPFRALGITPEGCSSFNFPRLLGETGAKVMLEEGRRIDAKEARELGLVSEVVVTASEEDSEVLLERAQQVAEDWVEQNRKRPIVEQGLVEKLKGVNAEESQRLAEAFCGREFLERQQQFAQDRKKTSLAWMFWAAKYAMPLLSKL